MHSPLSLSFPRPIAQHRAKLRALKEEHEEALAAQRAQAQAAHDEALAAKRAEAAAALGGRVDKEAAAFRQRIDQLGRAQEERLRELQREQQQELDDVRKGHRDGESGRQGRRQGRKEAGSAYFDPLNLLAPVAFRRLDIRCHITSFCRQYTFHVPA